MSRPITTAFVSDDVELAVDVANAQAGETCRFDIFDDQQNLLETVFGDISSGTARASWVVDLKGRLPPVDITFTASVLGQTADAGALKVVPAGKPSTAAWITDDKASAGPQADAVVEEDDDPNPDFSSGAGFDLTRPVQAGQRMTLRVEVGDDEGFAVATPFDILFERFDLQSDDSLAVTPTESLPFHLTPKNAARAVRLHWTVPQGVTSTRLVFRVSIAQPGGH